MVFQDLRYQIGGKAPKLTTRLGQAPQEAVSLHPDSFWMVPFLRRTRSHTSKSDWRENYLSTINNIDQVRNFVVLENIMYFTDAKYRLYQLILPYKEVMLNE